MHAIKGVSMQNILLGYNRTVSKIAALVLAVTLSALAGCSGAPSTATTTTTTTATATAATLQLSASSTSVPSDNSASTTITVTALSAANAALSGVVVTLSTDTGIVSASSVTTGASGTATFTFSSGTASLANRTATITASAGATAQIPIQITGSTLKWISTSPTTIANDGLVASTVVFQVLNAQGAGVAGSPYTAAWSTGTGGQVTVTPTSGVTDSSGNITLTVKGVTGTSGTANVSATAVGSTVSTPLTVSPASSTFAITNALDNTTGVSTPNPTTVAMHTTDTLTVTASAPATVTSVTFVTSAGSWQGGTTSLIVPVSGGVASATLTGQQAGTTSITAVGNTATGPLGSANLTVSVTASTPYSITLQATPSTVSKSTGTSSGVSTLIATVKDASGQPVGNAPVTFSLSNTTGGGETISPVVAYTASVATSGLALGQASATFTSGSLSSTSAGVQVHAAVLGTTVATYPNNVPVSTSYVANPGPSGNDASIIIGGAAGSIAFSIASKIVVLNTTTYQLPMSVLVTDVSGNPVPSAVVTLSVWPSAWSTGTQRLCDYDTDNGTNQGTFVNEDINGNLRLDTGEDGYRKYLATGVAVSGGTMDGQLTPPNAAAGAVPLSVTTDVNGLANFNLTYLKNSALWTIDTIRASTGVVGSETVSQTTFRLPAATADTGAPTPTLSTCFLNPPYQF